MSYQSLYRRYRSQTFAEVLGQEHVTGALRNAVREGRVGHGYLFSGPRGTGKTSTARILAKVLNCENPVDGEPCATCENCVAVAEGRNVDWMHELDAASNNGVEAMRDLLGRVSMGTSGNRKVYILDEVHMLSKGASNTLLKTLEEPPEHVVFVLATTEPEKVLPTIRSRTQHFDFKLLSAETLAAHVRHVISDAGLELDDDVVEHVVRSGGGSARDTLSALDQVAAAGGVEDDASPIDDIVVALANRDAGAALVAVDTLVRSGQHPRTLADALIGSLRDAFLVAMGAPRGGLTDLAEASARTTAESIGPAALTGALEGIGSAIVEMRHAPDPRIPLEVALVRLTRPETGGDLAARVAALERAVAGGGSAGGGGGSASGGGGGVSGSGGGGVGGAAAGSGVPDRSIGTAGDAGSGTAGSGVPDTSYTPVTDAGSGVAVAGGGDVAAAGAGGSSGSGGPDEGSGGGADASGAGGGGAGGAAAGSGVPERSIGTAGDAGSGTAGSGVPDTSYTPATDAGSEKRPVRGAAAARAHLAAGGKPAQKTAPADASSAPAGSRPSLGGVRRAQGAPAQPAPDQPAADDAAAVPPGASPAPESTAPLSAAAATSTENPSQRSASAATVPADSAPPESAAAAPPESAQPEVAPPESAPPDPAPPTSASLTMESVQSAWPEVLAGLKGRAKALFKAGTVNGVDGSTVTVSVPSETHREHCAEKQDVVVEALSTRFASKVRLSLTVDGPDAPPAPSTDPSSAPAAVEEEEEIVDLEDLTDAPDPSTGGVQFITDAFPGAEIEES